MSEPMLKKSLPNGYRRKLAHVIVLLDGTELVTLRDAANALLDVFGSVNARSGEPDNATRLLLLAAKTGRRPDITAESDVSHPTEPSAPSVGYRRRPPPR